jgi:hypothetical protein
MDVMEVPDDRSVRIGQLPLEQLDYVVDPQSRSLIGNPRLGSEHIIEMYRTIVKDTGMTAEPLAVDATSGTRRPPGNGN